MKAALTIGFTLVALVLSAQDALEIVRKADTRARGNSSVATVTIQTVRPKWTREMTVKSWTSGSELAMILITAPARDKGIVYLKRKKEVWNWIPAIERNIKLPPSMMSQSWMGTDFSNDDLVKEASIVSDYRHRLAGDSMIGELSCYKIELIPKPESSVVWGKILLWVDKKDYLMMRVEYYDEEGELVNTMTASAIRILGGRLLPSRLEMIPAGKPGQKTVLVYQSLQFDIPLNDNFFTTQNMPRVQ